MSRALGESLAELLGFLLITAPLVIQLIIYPISKLCFKKAPSTLLWWICFGVDTALLGLIVFLYLLFLTEEAEPMDVLVSVYLVMIWIPWYICVLIWGIVKSVIAAVKTSKKKSDDYIAVDYDSSEF